MKNEPSRLYRKLFYKMTERLEVELLGDRGFQDVLAVINCAARLSNALRPNDDPGVMTSGDGPGAAQSESALYQLDDRL
jgi:hypothetical protein